VTQKVDLSPKSQDLPAIDELDTPKDMNDTISDIFKDMM